MIMIGNSIFCKMHLVISSLMCSVFDENHAGLYAVLLGSSADDLANSTEAVSFLCLGRICACCHISFPPRTSVIKVCVEMLRNSFEVILLVVSVL